MRGVLDCKECPAYKCDFCSMNVDKQTTGSAEEVVRLVEEWSTSQEGAQQ